MAIEKLCKVGRMSWWFDLKYFALACVAGLSSTTKSLVFVESQNGYLHITNVQRYWHPSLPRAVVSCQQKILPCKVEMVSSDVWVFLTTVAKYFSLSRRCKKIRLRRKSDISTRITGKSLIPYCTRISLYTYLRAGLANFRIQ
jgi:hypothetical protein